MLFHMEEPANGTVVPDAGLKKLMRAAVETLPKSPPTDLSLTPPPKKGGRKSYLRSVAEMPVRKWTLKNVPCLELDKNGFALRPWSIGQYRRSRLTIGQRKTRFVLFYNWSGCNIGLACAEAGVKKDDFEAWKKDDPLFVQRLKEAREDVADRLQLRLMMRVGLIPEPEDGIKIHDAALISLIRHLRPNLVADLMEDEPKPKAKPSFNIPRPPSGPA